MAGFFSDTLVPHFQGRLTRRRFWAATVMYLVVTSALSMLWRMLFWQPMSVESWNFVDFVISAAALYFYVVLVSVLVRRLHDFGRSGWWVLLFLIPVVAPIAYIVIGCISGNPAANLYGAATDGNLPYDSEEALVSLARLKASGLISEEEYQAKRQSILDKNFPS